MDAIKELHDYLAKSPSVVYPEDVLAYLPAIEAENAELREELARARDPQRIGGQADPSSFVYAIEQLREFRWQHATNDEDAIPYINNVAAAHERENAELREQGARLFDKVLELGTENARLKDTGRALLQCVRKLNTAVTCEGAGCPVCDDCDLYRLISDPRIEVDK